MVRIHGAVRAALSAHWYDEHDLLLAASDAFEEGAKGDTALGPSCISPRRSTQTS